MSKGLLSCAVAVGLLPLASLAAATGEPASPLLAARTAGLHWPDWIIVGLYVGTVLGLGWFYSRRQSETADYFIAAKRHIHPGLIGISLFATLLSTISYLAKPGEMINKGPVTLLGQIVAVPFSYVIVGHWLIPLFMRQRVTSAYELLEQRLGLAARLLGALMFVGLRLVWMGLLIYLSSTALTVIVGLDLKWIPAVSVVTGIVAVIYTSMGGLKTVVMTDVLQFVLLFLGALVTIGIITLKMEGFSWFTTTWSPQWDTQPWFSMDPHVRVTFFSATLSVLIWRVATAGSDQTAIQRYMATRDAVAARQSYLVTSLATIVVSILLALLGMALLGFFNHFPEALGPGMTLQKDADRIFPYFIAHYLPVGVAGLVVAAALAAAMSSVDSGVNSITAVVMRDFLERFGWHPRTEAGALRFTKRMALAIGASIVIASMSVKYISGNFTEMTSKTANLMVTPIFVLFILALWVPFATPLGALLGCAYGVAAAVLIAFWDTLTGRAGVSFLWVGPVALIVNLAVALSVSRWGPPRGEKKRTWRAGAAGIAILLLVLAALIY